ncbi:MAG TPA: AAA family ATPase [Isosphaeraceae bacterium]|jgi:pilus assembly protein CpaE|nr:AAA family ATPase [Isosphaeraceae bacterium]
MSQAYVISDHEAIGSKVRQILCTTGQDCPASNALSLEVAVNRLSQARPDLVVLVLAPSQERALTVLGELRNKAACRVLVVGPAAEPKLVLRALRGGADDFVDEVELETDLKTALIRLQSGTTTLSEPGKTIGILAPSGGSGSSTLAVNVAAVLAKEHKSTLLVDLKLETGDLASLLDVKPTYTLANLCQNVTRMDRVMFERSLVRHPSGVHLLASPQLFADIGHVTTEGIRQALTLARVLFPYIVVDLDHSFRAEQTQVLRQADVILLVLRLEFTSLRNTRRTIDHLEHLGIGRDRFRLVVNRYGQAKEVPAVKAEEALGMKIHHYVPDDARSIIRANNNGVPVVLESPSAKVSKSVVGLAMSVNGRHKDS